MIGEWKAVASRHYVSFPLISLQALLAYFTAKHFNRRLAMNAINLTVFTGFRRKIQLTEDQLTLALASGDQCPL